MTLLPRANFVKMLCTGALLALSLTGCQSAYYAAMEKVGVHKRDILVDRVEAAKAAQQQGQQQFKDALDELSQLINFHGGDLQDAYEKLNDEYQASQQAADEVTHRIDKVENVALALFDEWQDELGQYDNAKLKAQSARKLKDTQTQFNQLLKSMRRAEQKIAPVLTAMHDNVLFLKHNLNAKAVGAIKSEFTGLKQNVASLVAEMNKAIADSDKFIAKLNQNP